MPKNHACAGWAQANGRLCDQTIETYMDFTKPSSYGWRDDTEDITALLADTTGAVTIKKVHNMEIVYKLQQQVVNQTANAIPESQRYSNQPTISYCWYWGCSPVCTPERHGVNRWWLVSSLALTGVNLVNVILVAIIWRRSGSENNEKGGYGGEDDGGADEADEGDVEEQELIKYRPRNGRRRRLKNPSGLLF